MIVRSCYIYMYHCPMTRPTPVNSSRAGAATLQPGDVVEVCEGELIHLQGKVVSISGDTVTIQPKHEELTVRMRTL